MEPITPPDKLEGPNPGRLEVETPHGKKRFKAWLPIAVVILLATGGFGYYAYNTTQQLVEEEPVSDQTDENLFSNEPLTYPKANHIVYAFGTSRSAEGFVYSRPATGGDRVELASFSRFGDLLPFAHKTYIGNSYLFVLNEFELWVGTNTDPAKKIYETPAGKFIAGAALSPDGKTVAFGEAAADGSSQSVPIFLINVADGQVQKISDGAGSQPFWFQPHYWLNNKTISLTAGAYGTDAPPPPTRLLDIDAGSITEPVAIDDATRLRIPPVVSPDLRFAIYATSTVDETQAQPNSLEGYYVGPPYTVYVADLTTGESRVLKAIGDKGGQEIEELHIGWLQTADNNYRAYYTESGRLYVEELDSSLEIYFNAGAETISSVRFATEDELIIGKRLPDGGEVITYFDLGSSRAETIMETTVDTQILSIFTRQ